MKRQTLEKRSPHSNMGDGPLEGRLAPKLSARGSSTPRRVKKKRKPISTDSRFSTLQAECAQHRGANCLVAREHEHAKCFH